MDAITPTTRNSRWSRDPILQHGRAAVARVTDRDIEIFRLLARHRYLPADDIHALVGGGLKPIIHRLNLLSRSPNLFINRPHQQRQNADANYRRLIYELDDRGAHVLRERGLSFLPKTYHRNFAHEFMVCRIMASFEIAVKADPSLRLITWQEIMTSEKTPEATRNAPRPNCIPVSFVIRGEHQRTDVYADAHPFGIEQSKDGARSYFFFPGIEADCGTEPLEASDFERSSIHKKFSAYRAIVEQGIHQSHFGFPNFFVPIITTTLTRMESMMRCLERITAGRGSKMFLFKAFPAFTSFEPPPLATGHMLTEPWQRVGYVPFHFG
jgi:hypothetical protein